MNTLDLILSPQKENLMELGTIHLSPENKKKLHQLLKEFKYIHVLEEFNLPVDNKLFLFGHTGCGKTTTANSIAKSLDKKIITLNLGNIVSSRLGETARNITEVFKKASREQAVLFLDEFDYVGRIRDYDQKDSGEMKRLVNTLIQLIDQLSSSTLLIAATNHSLAIDSALLRRFQLKLKFELPSNHELDNYYDSLLSQFPKEFGKLERKYDISYAEAKDLTFSTLKEHIIASEELKATTEI